MEQDRQDRQDRSDDRITLAHGHGGLASHRLIRDAFLPLFSSPELDPLDDGAVLSLASSEIVLSTDSFVVQPVFFPGGDIGKLSIAGTVNDVAVMGARPVIVSVAFIIEEGFRVSDLAKIVQSMADECLRAGVKVVTGDTKVVPRGAADGIFINTTGIGIRLNNVQVSGSLARVGQVVLLTGPAGDHGAAIVCARKELGIRGQIESDCRALGDLAMELFKALGRKIAVMRDPTRGGVATALNEIARSSGVGIEIDESKVPIRPATRAVSEILGFDPLYLANEGALLVFVDQDAGESALEICRKHPAGKMASIIGSVRDDLGRKVVLKTVTGGRRIMDMLVGEMLPRIC